MRRFDVMRERQLRLARGRQRRRFWLVLLVVVQVAIIVTFVALNRQSEALVASLSVASSASATGAAGDSPGDPSAAGEVVAIASAAVLGAYSFYEFYLLLQMSRKKPAEPAGTLAGRLEAFFKDGKGLFDPDAVRKVEVIENCGSGDCLFLSVEKALKEAGRSQLSVAQLREIVAESMTEAKLGVLKLLPKGNEYAFMKGVETLEDLKAKVRSRDYWGDELALTALSEELGLRIEVVTAERGIIQRAGQVGADASQLLKEGIVVLLQDQHYRVLKVNDRYIHDLRFDSRPALPAPAA